jgi:hypothetical protein
MSDSIIETMQTSAVTSSSGGTVTGNVFIGGRVNVNLAASASATGNLYADNFAGGFGVDGDSYVAAATACTGALTTSVSWSLRVAPNGKQIQLLLPATIGTTTASAIFSYGVVIPVQYRPTANLWYPCFVEDNGVTLATPGLLQINASTGVITVLKSAAGDNFTNAATGGLPTAISVAWNL